MALAYEVERISTRALRALNYTPEVDRIRRISDSRTAVSLGDVTSEMGTAYRKFVRRVDARGRFAAPLINQGDLFRAEPGGRPIALAAIRDAERHRISKWQVLIAGTGTLGENELYGRPIIGDSRLSGKLMSEHIFSLTFLEPGSDINLFTYAFLCSSTGLRAIRSMSYGTKLLHIRRDMIRSLPIPLAGGETTRRVADLIRVAVAERERFLASVAEARQALEQRVGIRELGTTSRERVARCVVVRGRPRTLGAWNHASVGETIESMSARWSCRLGDLVPASGIFRGGRMRRIACKSPHGVDFHSQRDVFAIRAIPQRILVPDGREHQIFAPANALLVGGQGTLGENELFGRVAPVSPDQQRSAVSEHLLRIVPTSSRSFGVLYSFLSSELGLQLIRTAAVGTKLLGLRRDLLRRLPVPDLTEIEWTAINVSVREALAAKHRAHEAEQRAVSIVENEVIPQWLA